MILHRALAGCRVAVASTVFLSLLPATAAERPSIAGVWWATTEVSRITPVDGGELPFTPEGSAAYRENMEGLATGTLTDNARKFCVLDGVPRIWMSDYPFEIIETADQITILYETNHAFRIVKFAPEAPPVTDEDRFPWYFGHSYGHWEGDTFVVESVDFNDRTFLDDMGVPHSDQLRVVERIRKIDNGRRLEVLATIENPQTFTQPWTARFVFGARPDVRLDVSYTCGDEHRDHSERTRTVETLPPPPAPSSVPIPSLYGLWAHGPIDPFRPVLGHPGPVQFLDPYVDFDNFFTVVLAGDHTNPYLLPWAAAEVKRHADAAGTEHAIPSPQEQCYPSGVPNVATLPGPIQFLQTPERVTILYSRDHQVRQVHLNVPHSEDFEATWYGESVGHYEGNALVIDTVGQNDKTPVDFFGTPHTDQIHVVERYRLIDSGQTLELRVTVDDPGAFVVPWTGVMLYRRVPGPMPEESCAENNRHMFGESYDVPMEE